MANDRIKNLKPFTSDQSREKAAENGHKGGIASGISKREKKDRKQKASELLDLIVRGAGIDKLKKFFNLNGIELTAYEVMLLSCIMKAIQKGDVNALEKLLKIAGEQFTELLDVSIGKSEKLADIMVLLIKQKQRYKKQIENMKELY